MLDYPDAQSSRPERPKTRQSTQQVRWKIAVMVSRYTRKEPAAAALWWIDG